MTDFTARRLLTVFRQAAAEVYDRRQPADLLVGQVESVSPLVVRHGAFRLPQTLLLLPGRLRGALQTGDAVALLKGEGGQRYLVLDVLEGGSDG